MKKEETIKWFWSHQRNMTVLQSDFVSKHFRGKGYFPEVPFSFDNQIFVYDPVHGIYIFYDEELMPKAMRQVQDAIQKQGPELIKIYHDRTNQLFGHLLMIGRDIAYSNISIFTNKELKELFVRFRDAMGVGPIITVQLWGIESCWLEGTPLPLFLQKRLKELGKDGQFAEYRQKLSACTGKTVAYAEREEFLMLLAHLAKDRTLAGRFATLAPKELAATLAGTKVEIMINKHREKYGWITAEYRSLPWDYERWLQVIKDNLPTAKQQLESQRAAYEKLLQEKHLLLEELQPPQDVQKVIAFLDECNAQRDWAKGKFCEAFLYFRTLAEEIAGRFGITFEDLYTLHSSEIVEMLSTGIIDRDKIVARKEKGAMILIKHGVEVMHEADELDAVKEREGIMDFFRHKPKEDFAKGFPACRGKATGVARVIDEGSKIGEFKEGEILITYMTTMEFTPLFPKAKAIVCDEGGISSHAAIVSREFNIPCIVGAKRAMKIIKTGDTVEVDAEKGVVRLVKPSS